MARQLKTSDVNHLRRLLGYVRCELGQTPDEFLATCKAIAPSFEGELSPESKRRLTVSYEHAVRIPLYVRAAVKALEKVVKEIDGDVVDADNSAARAISHKPLQLRR